MPPRTQANWSLGTGQSSRGTGGYRQPGFGGGVMGPIDPSLYQLGAQFNQTVGGMPSTQVATNVEQGIPVNPNANAGGGPPNPDATTNVTEGTTPSASPAQAGNMNAMMPGTFNGNPANGVPGSEVGWTPAMGMPTPEPSGSQAPPPPAPAQPPVNPGMPQVQVPGDMEQMPQLLGAAAGETAGQSQEPVAAPAQEMAPLSAEATAAPQEQAWITSSGQAYTGPVYQLGNGPNFYDHPKPPNFDEWPQPRRDAWKAEHLLSPAPQQSGTGNTGQTGNTGGNQQQNNVPTFDWTANGVPDWTFGGMNFDGKPPTGPLATPVVIPPTENIVTAMAKVSDPYLQQVMAKLVKQIEGNAQNPGLRQLSQDPSFINSSAGVQALNTARAMEDALKKAGVDYPILTSFLASISSGGGGGNNGGGGDGTPDGTSGTGSNTSLPTLNWQSQINQAAGAWNNLSGDDQHRQFLLEYAAQLAERENAMQRQQQGVNIFSDAYGRFQDNPLRTQSLQMSQDLLNNPDNTPWQQIENRRIENIDRSASQAQDELASSLNRRGLAAGAGIGSAVGLQQLAGDERARAMSDLAIEKAATEREAQYRALGNAGSQSQLYYGGDIQAAGQLANMVAGAPQQATNPYAGWSDNYVNYQGFIEALKARNNGGFGWGDALGIIGGGAGAFLGGPGGAYVGQSIFGNLGAQAGSGG